MQKQQKLQVKEEEWKIYGISQIVFFIFLQFFMYVLDCLPIFLHFFIFWCVYLCFSSSSHSFFFVVFSSHLLLLVTYKLVIFASFSFSFYLFLVEKMCCTCNFILARLIFFNKDSIFQEVSKTPQETLFSFYFLPISCFWSLLPKHSTKLLKTYWNMIDFAPYFH